MKKLVSILPAVIASIFTSIFITGAFAVANYKAVPDTVPRQIPYRGNLDLDGEPYNGSLDMSFSLFRSSSGGEAAWTETQSVTVYGGRFSALLGSSSSQSVEALTGIVTAGDDLYLEVSLDGNVLMGRQRFFPAPFALWTTTSTDFNVDHDMVVGNNLSVNGTLNLNGTDFKFGDHPERGNGGRALVHDHDDTLVINYDNDFSGGTRIVGVENNGSRAILKLSGNNQNMLLDGNEIDVFTDTNTLLLNNNSHGLVTTGGGLDVAGDAVLRGDIDVGQGKSIGIRNTNQCDCEWVNTNDTGSEESTWYCPDGKFIRGFKQERNCGDDDNCVYSVYCCFPCAYKGL